MDIFPAYAGVIPQVHPATNRPKDFPRVCGGDPHSICGFRLNTDFPRVCGGDPDSPKTDSSRRTFSPRMRG